MKYKSVYLKSGKEESIYRFHPWVFSGAILRAEDFCEGDFVSVFSKSGSFLAIGHAQAGTIAVRILTFKEEEIGLEFWKRRIRTALEVRKSVGLADNPTTDTYRLVHGEGDNLPGLIIDCYGKTAVIQAHSIGMHKNREDICEALVSVMGDRIDHVYYKSGNTLPPRVSAELHDGTIYGTAGSNVATENGLKFRIDWLHGQKTGFFVDQRENRLLLEKYAANRDVLNMFCYTGGFSVYAMRGGARSVHSVDSSEKAIRLTEENVELNFPNDGRHKAFCEDAFAFLAASPAKYDLVILDPPAFAKHQNARGNALKGYMRLNTKGFEAVRPGGIVFTFSCSQAISSAQFRNAVFTAAARAGRQVRILHQLHQPADHPINIYHPEGEYLKGLVLHVE